MKLRRLRKSMKLYEDLAPAGNADPVVSKASFGALVWTGEITPVDFTVPITALPPEVLARCFLWYIRTLYYSSGKTSHDNNPTLAPISSYLGIFTVIIGISSTICGVSLIV
ncbi:hypothetical protein GY45DRAFT_1332633, partial [Cubamyces sp. BRFM 1775]